LSAALTAVAPLQKDEKGAGRCHVDTLRDQMTFIEISSLRAEVGKPFPELFVNFAAHRTYLNSNCDTCGGVRVDCHITIRLSKKQLTKKNPGNPSRWKSLFLASQTTIQWTEKYPQGTEPTFFTFLHNFQEKLFKLCEGDRNPHHPPYRRMICEFIIRM